MIKGIGIDMVSIAEIQKFIEGFSADAPHPCAFVRCTFTPAEIDEARTRHNVASYFAGRFAVKKAVFKALAHLTPKGFELKCVETLADASGRPCVSCSTEAFAPLLQAADVTNLQVSISNENDYAAAIALVE